MLGLYRTRNVKLETSLRPATPADLPAIMAIEKSAPTAAHWSAAQYRGLSITNRIVLVVEDGSVQGFAIARDLGLEWEIENIVVVASVRRRGLGTRLMAQLLDLARSRGAHAVFLEVRESDKGARTMYEKCGFLAAGRRKSYYAQPNEDAIVYKFSFSPAAPKSY